MSDTVQIALITGSCTLSVSIVTAYFAYRAKVVSQETHILVNSRMSELLEINRASSKAEGKLEAKQEQQTKGQT